MTSLLDPPAPRTRPSLMRRMAMRPRRVLVRVHRWLSFLMLGWLVVIGITGATLAIDHQLNAWFRPELYQASDGNRGAQAAIDATVQRFPKARVDYVVAPSQGRGVYQVRVSLPLPKGAPKDAEPDARTAYVDPGTAQVNGARNTEEGFTWWMYRGHMFLWQDHGFLTIDGLDFVAGLAIAWLVVLGTGAYLWYWPGVKHWANAVRVRRGRGVFTFNLDLHKATGLVVVIPLTIVAFTGAAFSFPLMKNLYERATPAKAKFALWDAPDKSLVSASHTKNATALDADEVIHVMKLRYPERQVDGLTPPADRTGTWTLWVTHGFSPWTREGGAGNVYMSIDQYSGKTLFDGTPGDGNVAEQAWDDWSYPLHTGDWAGSWGRGAWVLVGFSPIILGTTGTLMWFQRRKKRRRSKSAQTPDPAVV